MRSRPGAARTDRATGLTFSAAIALLALMGWLSFLGVRRASEDERLVAHAFELLDTLDQAVGSLTSAESAQRSYLLTLDDERLAGYPGSVRALREQITSLRRLSADDALQSQRVGRLEQLAQPRLSRLDEGIRLAREKGPEAAREYVLAGGGSAAMKGFLDSAGAIREREKALLERRLGASRRSTVVSRALTLATGILAVVLLSIAVVALRRDIGARRQVEESLSHANAALTDQVENIRRRSAEIALLSEMSEMLHACRTQEEIARSIERLMPRLLPGTEGAAYFVAENRGPVDGFAQWPEGSESETGFPPDHCWGLRLGRIHMFVRGVTEPCLHLSSRAGCSLCVPIVASGRTSGLLHARRVECKTPDDESIRIMTAASSQIGLALSNLRLREELREQSLRDPLTGLHNRRYLDEAISREVSHSGRTGKSVAFLIADIDHFKLFNDRFGHAAGDHLLRKFADEIVRDIRGSDIAGRLGGEEFLVVLPEADRRAARARAETIRAAVARLSLINGNRSLGGTTVSIGVAVYPDDGDNVPDVLKRADEALYRAKAAGRNRVETFGDAEVPGPLATPDFER